MQQEADGNAANKTIQEAATYDQIFSEGGYEGVYKLPYYHSEYYPLFKEVLKAVQKHGSKKVLEVGCGPGGFAQMLLERTKIDYRGFDFSRVAVEQAKSRTGRNELFSLSDALSPESYLSEYDTIVCTEVLEHIEADLKAIENWKPGTFCVCSVPNFNADTHVRFFKDEDEVIERYGRLIDIEKVWRRKRPILTNLSLQNYFRELRWARYQPSLLMKILGFGNFDDVGGWFVLSGQKK